MYMKLKKLDLIIEDESNQALKKQESSWCTWNEYGTTDVCRDIS